MEELPGCLESESRTERSQTPSAQLRKPSPRLRTVESKPIRSLPGHSYLLRLNRNSPAAHPAAEDKVLELPSQRVRLGEAGPLDTLG